MNFVVNNLEVDLNLENDDELVEELVED